MYSSAEKMAAPPANNVAGREQRKQNHSLRALRSGESRPKNGDQLRREQGGQRRLSAEQNPGENARRPGEQRAHVAFVPQQQHRHEREQHRVHDDRVQSVERPDRDRSASARACVPSRYAVTATRKKPVTLPRRMPAPTIRPPCTSLLWRSEDSIRKDMTAAPIFSILGDLITGARASAARRNQLLAAARAAS